MIRLEGVTRKACRLLRSMRSDPKKALLAAARRLGIRIEPHCPTLLHPIKNRAPVVWHISNFENDNAGDVLLPVALRDLFVSGSGPIMWRNQHVRERVDRQGNRALIRAINASAGIVIGGGGLFLRDTNPNELSGWQWSCSLDFLREMKVPMCLFAVGYNRFRGQPDFDPIFEEHITALAEKSVYLGLRSHGSMRALRQYLPKHLHHRVTFQPCATTLLAKLYPARFAEQTESTPCIALNCAFDRPWLRYGHREEEIKNGIALAISRLGQEMPIKYYAHLPSDKAILPSLDDADVEYELVDLCGADPVTIVRAYQEPSLTIGMRGHAQLIPFGCQKPILSLISHDKLDWFLEDIRAPEWGVDVQESDLPDHLYSQACQILNDSQAVTIRLQEAQERLWQVSLRNVHRMRSVLVG